MKKPILSMIMSILVFLMIPGITILASDIDDALWHGTIQVTNNGTETSNVAIPLNINTQSFVNNGFSASTLDDIALRLNGIDYSIMPAANSTNPWIMHVNSIPDTTSMYYDLYSGGATGGKIVFFPDPASDGLTIPYDPSLALGNDFEIRITNVLPDTNNGTDKNLVYIEDSLRVYKDPLISNRFIAQILSNENAETTINPTANTISEVSFTGAATAWEAVSDSVDTSYIYHNTVETWKLFLAEHSGIEVPVGQRGAISKVTVYFRTGASYVNYYPKIRPVLRIGDTSYYGSVVDITSTGWVNRSQVYVNSPATSSNWTWDEIGSMGIGVAMWETYAGGHMIPYCSKIWVVIEYQSLLLTSIDTPITEFEIITVSANTTHLSLNINDISNSTTLGGNSVPNNLNDLIFFQNGSALYAENITVSVGGTPVSAWKWEYGDIFHDLIGDNDGTPVFRTSSSDPDVSAELISLSPVRETRLDTFTLTEITDFLTDIPEVPDTMYTELDFEYIPGAEAVNEILDESDTPQALWWFPFIYVGIILIGFMTYQLTTMSVNKQPMMMQASVDGSLLTMCIVMEVLMIVAGLLNPVPYWPAFLFPIPATALILSRKHWSWG